MSHNKTLLRPSKGETSKEILQFLKDGEGEMEIGKFKNVTLVLGLTGSGKSTFTQFLTGNDEGLFASETTADTGEFTILDKNHGVCRSTINSCTIIPTLYTDKVTKSGFYDCPGFGDTRSVKHDIAVTYFIKKVIDSVDSVKLLFVVNHHSVMEGVDRQNFMMLVKNVIKMVQNIDKFKSSIALVVTKVDNKYIVKKRQFVLVPDEAVIANVANFLEKAKESLEAKIQSNDDHIFNTEAIKFIDILLEKNGDDYSRIGLFRRPDEEGPLDRSTLLQLGKARMQKIIQSVQYVPKTSDDFGYTVSAQSLSQMHDLVDRVNEKLSATFSAMGQTILEHYTSEEMKSRDIEDLTKIVSVGQEALSAVTENRNYQSPIVLSNEIQKFAQTENVTLSMENVADVAHYDHFLGFIHQLSGLRTTSVEWLYGLKEAVDSVSDKREWLNLLVDLQTSLSDYAVLTDIRRNPSPSNALLDCIENILSSGSKSGQCEGLEDFLKQVFKNHLEKQYAIARKAKPNVREWELLKELWDFGVEFQCRDHIAGSVLIMKGQYVKFSDMNGKYCPRSIKSIKIFALKKVFVDQSYSRVGDKVEVVIIAPYWVVIGSPAIELDGADAADQTPSKAPDGFTSDWLINRSNGRHGSSGGNGGEGGMFWGMGRNCDGCQHLTVTANGGRGGAGQDGGDGAEGRDFHAKYEGREHGLLITVVYNTKVTDIIHYGEPGGNGGNGGDGGQGGPKGGIKFVLYGEGSLPKISAAAGRPGRAGAGGAPGKGGRSERRIHRVGSILIIPWWGNDDPITLPSASDGSWGQNGQMSRFTPQPTGSFSNPLQTLSEYIALMNAKINTTLSDDTTRKFLRNLENAKIEDVKHHVGRRSIVQPKVTYNVANKTSNPSFITKAFTFISTMTGIHHKSSRITSAVEPPINYHLTSYQGISTGDSQTHNGIRKVGSSADVPAVASGFDGSHLQSNLQLLDYLYRMTKRSKVERKNHVHLNDDDSDKAQRIAYRAYVPRKLSVSH